MMRLASKAMSAGGELVTRKRIEWDIAGNCTAPVGRDITLKAVGEHRRFRDWQSQAAWKRRSGVSYLLRPPRSKVLPLGFVVGLTMRCRKCQKCRRMRQMLWSDRAKNETANSFRTWFGTITIAPEHQYRFLCLARERQAKQGIDYDQLDYGEQFRLRVREIGAEVTKYLKRVRKEAQAPMRYLWVCEVHKSGEPHFHVLVHEQAAGCNYKWATLSQQWGLGFTKWNLVKSLSQATYLTKYLSKSTAARVRASVGYGRTSLDLAQPMDIGRDLQMSNADPQTLSSVGFGGRKSPDPLEGVLGQTKGDESHGIPSERIPNDRGPSGDEWLSRFVDEIEWSSTPISG